MTHNLFHRNTQPGEIDMTHLALNPAGLVVAHFLSSSDAAAYCSAWGCTHLPFNSRVHAVPAVGSTYRA